jgi:predicted PurR-regulated permease PerM
MEQKLARSFQIVGLAILVFGCYLVLRPFLTAALLAAVVCVSTWPAYRRIRKFCRGHAPLAALTTSLLLIVLLVLPLALITVSLANNTSMLIDSVRHLFTEGAIEPPSWLSTVPLAGDALVDYWRELAASRETLLVALGRLLDPARTYIISAGLLLGEGVLQMSLAVFIAFFFYRDGEYLVHHLVLAMSRMAGSVADDVMLTIANTTTSVVYGLIGSALAQGAAAFVGFLLAGVPGALLLGAATFLLSLAPMGPPIVWGGAAAWLFFWQGKVGWAIFMVLWGILVVSMIDNFLKPYLISRGSSMPFVLVLLGVLGGVIAFGFVGLFLGPVLLAVGLNLGRRWNNQPDPQISGTG